LKKSKLLKGATYISSGITILLGLSYVFKNLIFRIFYIFLGISSKDASAIGIIGGADGPTAIFIATKGGLSLQKLMLILILIFGVITIILFLLKRTIKNK